MKTNILKSFVAMLAIAATVCFAGCKDDESDEDIIPNIAIAESTMSFTNAEETKTLALESNADWQAVVPESADWVTVNPMSGNGDKTVTIAVAENTTGKAREAEVKFSALHPTYGVYDTKKLTIIQSANETEVEEENVIYSDGFDNGDGSKDSNNQWPAVVDRANPEGSAAADVTYKVNGKVTVRNSGKASNDSDYSSYKGSGVNKVFFGTLPASLVVENIALPADQANYVLSFGANRYDGTAGADNTYKNEELIVSISKNGEAWEPIEYAFEEGADLNGKWNLAEASFKLAEVPEALYIKFEAKIASIISIDDIQLATGGAGEQEITLPTEATPEVVEKVTVQEFLDAPEGGLYELTGVIKNVKNTEYGNFDLVDETASVYVYGIYDESGAKIFTAKGLKAGDTLTLKGIRSSHNGTIEVANAIYISHVPGEGGDEPAEEWGDDERYLSDEGLVPAQGTADSTNKFYGEQVIIEEQNYPALKLGTSSVVGTWTTEALGVEGDYTLSFYAFAWNNKPGQLVIAVDGETVATIDAEQTAGIANNTPYTIEVDQEKNHYTVELTGLTAESTITFSTTEGKTRVVLCGIKLAAPAAEPVEMTPAAVAEGYQGAKISWEAVEGAEAYTVSVVGNDAITPVEVDGEKTEAVITGLTDARKYVFAVEAIDAEENVIGEGETAETEVYTLVNWVEPTFEFAMSEDKTTYHLYAKDLAATNYFYVGAEVNIYKDGATTPIYTLKHAHGDAWLESAYQYARYLLGNVNQNKGWYWYDGEGNPVTKKDDGSAKEVNEVPASFFAAGEYTFDYEIAYGVCVNGTWAKDGGNYTSVAVDKAEADRVYFVTVDNLLRDADNHIERHSAGIETPVALATIEATLEFASVTAKAEGYQGAQIEWSAVETADAYKVVVNGEEVAANGELSHTVAPETLTDANEYTFTVKAYKGADLLAQKDVKTQVFTLTNRPAPEASFAEGVLTVATDLDHANYKMGNIHIYGVMLAAEVYFYKDGATTPAYIAKTDAKVHGANENYTAAIDIAQPYMKAENMGKMFNKWAWAEGDGAFGEATEIAPELTPGTYTLDVKGYYFPVIGGQWAVSGAVAQDYASANRIFFTDILMPNYTENSLAAVLPGAILREDKNVATVTIADPSAPEPVEMTPAAVAEGYQGAKVTWTAVEGAETYTVSVVGNDAITPVEVAGDKTEAVITGLTDARKYTFAVEAYDENDNLVGEGETAETEVWTLVNWEAPEFELVYNESADTYQLFARNVQDINYIYAGAEIKIYKDGAAEPIYTLKNWTSAQYLDNAAVAGRWKLSDMTNRKDWTWYKGTTDETLTSGEVNSVPASFFEPGVYTLDYTMHYALHVNAKWATHDGSWHDQEVEEGATYLHFYEKKNVMYTDGAVHREPKSNETAVELITIEEPINVELKVKAAIDEGTRNGRELFGSSDTNYTGIASINGMLESVKLSWGAVEADKIVIAYNGQTVEVEGTATEKVIEGLKTSPVEFTVSAVKGSETIAEETVSSDVYVLPDADTSAQWVAKYTESGYQILGTGWNTKQYAAAHVTFNVYEKDSATAVFDKDVNYKGGLGSIIAWAMGKAAPNGVCYAGPGNRACHGGDGDNWDEGNLPTGASVVDGKEVFTGLDPQKEYVVKYTLKVWPYIFDASNANNKEPYQSGSNILMNYFFKSMMIGGTADTYYDAVDLQGEADLTFEGVPEPEIEKITIAEFLAKADIETTYELTGKVVKIAKQDEHSNFYINDGTAELYIYGMLDNGDRETLKNKGILVGDEVTLQGVYLDYNGTKEISGATYISHKVATWPWITAVTPETVSFEATGGNEDVALTLRNGEGATPSLTGLTAPFSATWDANGVVKVACEDTADEAEQTLTIAFTDGNSVEVVVKKKAAGAGDAYTMIDRIADLTAGTYYMSAYLTKDSNNTDLSANPYHLATGAVNSGDMVTVSTNFENGDFTSSISTASAIELVAVDGKANTYYVKIGDKYLNSTASSNRKLELNTSASEWVVKNNSNGGITLTHSTTSVNLGSASATSRFLRSYGSEATLKYGVVFFKKN